MMIPRLLEKCTGFKRRPLEKSFPNICATLEPLRKLQARDYCPKSHWKPNKLLLNCTGSRCEIEDAILEYGRKNLVLFHVMIKDPYAQRYRRDEKIAITSFIANLGGLLGLWLGFSWISGAEVVFYITRGIFSLFKKSEGTKAPEDPQPRNHCSNSNTFEVELNLLKQTETLI